MIYQRKSPRWKDYDYTSSWWYFVTVCTKDREHYFGEIIDKEMRLSHIWEICEQEILHIEQSRESIQIHEYIIMPNHIHMIIIISTGRDGSSNRPLENISNNKDDLSNHPYEGPSLWAIIKLFKWNITKYANLHNLPFARQSRYHDHIIRNKNEYDKIRYYIKTNPSHRDNDSLK